MPRKVCLIPTCRSTSIQGIQFFRVPRNEKNRDIWKNMLLPHVSYLSDITSGNFRCMYVCENHFEKKFLSGPDSIQRKLCPSLFTPSEISSGVPTRPLSVQYQANNLLLDRPCVFNDHTYARNFCFNKQYTELYSEQYTEQSTEQYIVQCTEQSTEHSTEQYIEQCSEQYTELSTEQCSEKSREQYIGQCSEQYTEQSTEHSTEQYIVQCPEQDEEQSTEQYIVQCPEQDEEQSTEQYIVQCTEQYTEHSTEQYIGQCTEQSTEHYIVQCPELYSEQDKEKCIVQCTEQYTEESTNEEEMFILDVFEENPKGCRPFQKLSTHLPSVRTLNKGTQKTIFDCGLNYTIMEVLKQKSAQFSDINKICSLIFDEMCLTPQIDYDAGNDKIIGFVDEVVNARKFKYADHALVFAVRGVVGSWCQPIAYYFVEDTVNAMTLAALIKETIAAVVECGLDPVALICDQRPTNRTALKHLQEETKHQQVLNDKAVDGTIKLSSTTLHIVYDPPHLIKGIRNNFIAKDISNDGKVATWKDIVELYNMDKEIGEMRLLPKLTEECISEQQIKRMKVSNCTRVLSESVSKALICQWKCEKRRFGGSDDSKKNTAEIVLFFDQLFDSVNSCKGSSTLEKMRVPVTNKSSHLQFWKSAIEKLEKMTFISKPSAKARNSNCIVPSITNWIVTLKSFCGIWEKIQEKGVKTFYTRHLNQDTIETVFDKIRSMSYRSNPDCYTFSVAFKNSVINYLARLITTSVNCEEDLRKTVDSLEELFCHSNINKSLEDKYSKDVSENQINFVYPVPRSCDIVSGVINKKLAVQSIGLICKKIIKNNNCIHCKKTFMSTENDQFDEWTMLKNYVLYKGKYLTYPSPKILILINSFVECFRLQLGRCPQRSALKKSVLTQFLKNENVSWLGCDQHKEKTVNMFMELAFKLEVSNWCSHINKALKGTFLKKTAESLYSAEKLATKKFNQRRKKPNSNNDANADPKKKQKRGDIVS